MSIMYLTRPSVVRADFPVSPQHRDLCTPMPCGTVCAASHYVLPPPHPALCSESETLALKRETNNWRG